MADGFNIDDLIKQVDRDATDFDRFVEEQVNRIEQLPEVERDQAYRQLDFAKARGDQVIRQKYQLAEAGIAPPPPERPKESALQFILGSLLKPISAVSQISESILPTTTPEQAEELRTKALKNILPFYETLTGERVEKQTFSDTLEAAGFGPGKRLSEVAPGLFSETGEEWTKFKKGGFFDPTARGAAGLGLDVLGDPLNLIPVGKIAGFTGKTANKAVKGLTGKTIRELAFDVPAVRIMARGFNKFAFLSRNPQIQENVEGAFRRYLDNVEKIAPEELGNIAKIFKDPKLLGDEKVFNVLADLDDITRRIESQDLLSLSNEFPELIKTIVKEGEAVNFEKLADVFIANSGLNAKQIAAAKTVKRFFELEGIKKAKDLKDLYKAEIDLVGKKVLTDAEKAKAKIGREVLGQAAKIERGLLNNYVPRQLVDMRILDDLADPAIVNMDPGLKEALNRIVMSRRAAEEAGMMPISINSTLRDAVKRSVGEKPRLFDNFVEASNHAKIRGGRVNKNLGELMASSAISRRRRNAVLQLEKDLGEIYGPDLVMPNEVRDTIKQIFKNGMSDAESVIKLKKVWNKYFLNPLKYSLTFPFPAYHIRNIIDDTFRGFEKFGLKYADLASSRQALHILGDTDKLIDLGNGIKLGAKDLFQRFTNLGIYKNRFVRADMQRTLQSTLNKVRDAQSPIRAKLRQAAEFLPISETFALKWNNHARIKGGLVSLKDSIKNMGIKSMDDPNFDKALLKAAKDSKKAFIDIADLGPVDNLLAQVIPFYRFTRKNIPFQIETLITNPQRISKIAIARKDLQTEELSDEDNQLLAPYLRDNINLVAGDNVNGNHIFLSGTGLSIEELNRLWSSQGWLGTLRNLTIAQAAPPFQAVYGFLSNRHPFFGTELDDFRARQTNKVFHDNKLINKLIGGISKTPVRKDPKTGKVEYRYELDNPKQYFAIMTVLTPAFAAAAGNVAAIPPQVSGLLTPRAINIFDQYVKNNIGVIGQIVKNMSGVKLSELDLEQIKINKMAQDFIKEYDVLRRETQRLNKFYDFGLDLSGEEATGITDFEGEE